MEFACHVFPPADVTEMQAMGSPSLPHNMSYAAAHAMFYLVAGAHRIQLLNEMEATHTGCGVQEGNLKRRIAELEKDVHGFEKRCGLLASEKTGTEEIRSALEAKVDSLT